MWDRRPASELELVETPNCRVAKASGAGTGALGVGGPLEDEGPALAGMVFGSFPAAGASGPLAVVDVDGPASGLRDAFSGRAPQRILRT